MGGSISHHQETSADFPALASYYRGSCPASQHLLTLLADFTKANTPLAVQWTTECNKAFSKKQPVLQSLDFSLLFYTPAVEASVCI